MSEHHLEACIYEPAIPIDSPEGRERRKLGIGASEWSPAMGMSKYKDASVLAAEKLGQVEPFAGNDLTELGSALEQHNARKYEKIYGYSLHWPMAVFGHPDLPFLKCTPDTFRTPQGEIVAEQWANVDRAPQLKYTTQTDSDVWGPSGSETYPEDYWIQVQAEMFVMGFKASDLVVLFPRGEQRVYHIPGDRDFQNTAVNRLTEFWTNLQRGIVPEPDYSKEDARDMIKARVMRGGFDKSLEVTLPDYMAEILSAREKLLEESRIASARVDEMNARIQQLMGDKAGVGLLPGWRVTRSIVEKKEYTVPASKYPRLTVKRIA
jgi:putative phage-type endonuclease